MITNWNIESETHIKNPKTNAKQKHGEASQQRRRHGLEAHSGVRMATLRAAAWLITEKRLIFVIHALTPPALASSKEKAARTRLN
jgi:hypothetical protein